MGRDPDANDVARALYASIGLFVRRLRQTQTDGDLTMPENSALARLDRGGPTTPTALAKLERITPQSMGATLAGLEARGLVERRPHPEDGRQVVLSLTDAGLELVQNRRNAKTGELTQALATHFTPAERTLLQEAASLIERLAQSL